MFLSGLRAFSDSLFLKFREDISSVCNFVPSWDEVKSVRKPCRFITSSFILQEKAHSDDKILLSILSVLAGAGYDGSFGMPPHADMGNAAVLPSEA